MLELGVEEELSSLYAYLLNVKVVTTMTGSIRHWNGSCVFGATYDVD